MNRVFRPPASMPQVYLYRAPVDFRKSYEASPIFLFHCWLANLRVLKIDEIKSVPHVPESRPFVERLIGTVRR